MEDGDGVLSFDFEGGLDTVATTTTTTHTAIANGGGPHHHHHQPAQPAITADPNSAVVGPGGGGGRGRSFRQTVCRHWLRGLCMKGDACGFLHQYDKARMPVCRFFRMYGECREQDCVYKHSDEDIKECNMYKMGFCPNGPDCKYRHAKLPGPPPPVEEVFQKIQQMNSFNYGRFNQHKNNNYNQQGEKPQLPLGAGLPSQSAAVNTPALQQSNPPQTQTQNQQSQEQQQQPQVTDNQVQGGVPNGMPNQATTTTTRASTPLPPGPSRCVWSFQKLPVIL